MFTNPLSYNNFPGYQKDTLEYYYDAFFAECRAYGSSILIDNSIFFFQYHEAPHPAPCLLYFASA